MRKGTERPTASRLVVAMERSADSGRAVIMDVYLISPNGLEVHAADELSQLLDKPDALIWVDIGRCTGQDTGVLSEVFGFHEIAVRDCVERNHVSKIHVYDDHVFTVLHAPEIGTGGHVHYVELDQFLGRNYLVTVHGPLNPAVNPEVAFLDTGAVLQRLESGHLQVRSPFELSSAIIASLTRREIELIAGLAKESGRLEQRVTLAEVTRRPRAVPRRTVQGLVRAARDPHHRRAQHRNLRPDGQTGPVPAGGREAAGRRHRRPVRAGGQHGRRATRIPARRHRLLPDPDQHPHDPRRRGLAASRPCSRTTTCARSPPGWRSWPYPPR